jgi:lipoic acid synthetase
MEDLLESGCKVLTLGQYLQPTIAHMPVEVYIAPQKFEFLGELALQKGFRAVESGPLVRSSYHAEKHLLRNSSPEK